MLRCKLKHCYAIKFRCCKLKKHVATSWTGVYFFQQIFHLLLVLPPSQQILTQQNLRNLVWLVENSIAASLQFSNINKDGGRRKWTDFTSPKLSEAQKFEFFRELKSYPYLWESFKSDYKNRHMKTVKWWRCNLCVVNLIFPQTT